MPMIHNQNKSFFGYNKFKILQGNFMDYDIFSQNPRDKLFDILFNANRNLVQNELEKLLEKFVAMSIYCEKNGFDERALEAFISGNQSQIYDGVNDICIALSGDILSQNE